MQTALAIVLIVFSALMCAACMMKAHAEGAADGPTKVTFFTCLALLAFGIVGLCV